MLKSIVGKIYIRGNIIMLYGFLLKTVRKRKGYTQQQVADAIKISRVKYSRLETNLIPMEYEILVDIAEFYGTTIEDFILWAKLFNSPLYPLNIAAELKK